MLAIAAAFSMMAAPGPLMMPLMPLLRAPACVGRGVGMAFRRRAIAAGVGAKGELCRGGRVGEVRRADMTRCSGVDWQVRFVTSSAGLAGRTARARGLRNVARWVELQGCGGSSHRLHPASSWRCFASKSSAVAGADSDHATFVEQLMTSMRSHGLRSDRVEDMVAEQSSIRGTKAQAEALVKYRDLLPLLRLDPMLSFLLSLPVLVFRCAIVLERIFSVLRHGCGL